MEELYPVHCKRLREADFAPDSFPKLGEVLDEIERRREDDNQQGGGLEKKKKKRRRQTWFCIGVSTIWQKPIHRKIKELKTKYGLNWLRHSMSYHKFLNVSQLLRGDLTNKLMSGTEDSHLVDRESNCDIRSLRESDRGCIYGGRCRESMLIYSLRCKCCDKEYMGKTQRYWKTRTMEHIRDVCKLVYWNRKRMERGIEEEGEVQAKYLGLDSFARHFAEHCKDCRNKNEVKEDDERDPRV